MLNDPTQVQGMERISFGPKNEGNNRSQYYFTAGTKQLLCINNFLVRDEIIVGTNLIFHLYEMKNEFL